MRARAQAIQRIAEEQHATLFVPVSIAQYSVYEALAAQRLGKLGCAACTLDAPSVALLNDKLKFSALCAKLGVAAPQCFAVTSARQLAELNSRWDEISSFYPVYPEPLSASRTLATKNCSVHGASESPDIKALT